MKVQITLRVRLVMLMVAAILPLFALSMVTAWLNADAAISRTTDNLKFAASLVAANQERVVDASRQVLLSMVHAPGLAGGLGPDCGRFLQTMREELPIYANLGIVGLDGNFRCDALGSGAAAFGGDRDFFQAALAQRDFVAGAYLMGRAAGIPVVGFAMPLMNDERQVTAVAFATVDLKALSTALADSSLALRRRLVITDRQGAVLAAAPANPALIGQTVPSPLLQEAVKTMRSGVAEGPDGDGQARIFAFLPAGKLKEVPFFIAVSADRDEVLAPALQQLGRELLVLTLVAFAGGWLAWLMGGRVIMKPTREILAATRQIQRGQLDARIPIGALNGKGEFARIADGFNLMADSLQQRESALELELQRSLQAYSTLELTVNSMHEGMIAVDTVGRSLLINEPAKKILSIDENTRVLSSDWIRQQGFFAPDTRTPLAEDDLPLNRALKGEHGLLHTFMRNDSTPQGRLLCCRYHPMRQGEDIVGALCVFSDVTEMERLQLEQAETQRRLLDAQHLGRIGAWELNLQTQALWVSDEVFSLYGVTRDSLGGHPERLCDQVHPDDREDYLRQHSVAAATGQPAELECRIITAAGEVRWMHQYDRLQTDSEGRALYRTGLVQDITERKRAEQLVARSAELLNRTGALARVGGWELLVATMTSYWSEANYHIHEQEPGGDVPLETAFDFYPPEAQPVIRAAVAAALADASPWDLVLPMTTAKGRRIWVRTQGRALLQDGKVVRLVGAVQDITEQYEAQAHLRLLETCLSRLNDMVVITEAEPFDEPGPRIVYVNEAFERRTGYCRDEVLGKSPRLLQGPNTQRDELNRIGAALRKWRPVQAELINYTKSGEAFWLELDIVPIADTRGWFTHWVAVERDVTRRKLAERALIESEQRYAALFDTAPLPMLVYDAVTRRFLTVNRAALLSYGYTLEEFLSMTLFDVLPEADRGRLRRQLGKPAEGKKGRWQHCRKGGLVFPVEVKSHAVQYAGQAARFVVVVDVSAQVKAEKDVQDYLFTLQRAADATQAITWHQTLEGSMQEIAEQARGVIGTHMAMVSFASDADWAQAINALSLSEKYVGDRERIALPDGSGLDALVCTNNRAMRLTQAELEVHPRWRGGEADRTLTMRGWLAIPLMGRTGKNIGLLQLSDKYEGEFTQQDEYVAMELAQLAAIAIENSRLLQEVSRLNAGLEQTVSERTVALARQEALFRALAEQAPEVIWTIKPNGSVTYFNRAWFDLVGGELEDWVGDQWYGAVHPEDLAGIKENWRLAKANQSLFTGIRRVRAKDGSHHTMSYRASPVLGDQGEVVFWVGIDTDITEIKTIEAALRLSNQELEAFSYSVSHDLRSPLNTIDGFSRLLAKQVDGHSGEKVAHYLSRIQAGVAQMGQLIEDLLSLAQVSRAPLRNEPVNLSALARGILDECLAHHPERQVALHIESGLQAHGDGRLVRVVMENLLKNAWKFTSRQVLTEIHVGQQSDAAGLPVFFVRDNGAGFDMAYADKLFNPFQRLHAVSEFPGTGIGLATVSRVIRRHGGRLWAEAAPGLGASFFFTLPRAAVSA